MSLSTNGHSFDPLPVVRIFGVPIVRTTIAGALAAIERAASGRERVLVSYANAHTLNVASEDRGFHAVLTDRSELVLNDGLGVQLAARMRGERFPENLNGSDFNPHILRMAAERSWPVYLLGASEGVAERAAQKLVQAIPRLKVVGTHHGFFDESETDRVVEKIASAGPAVLMVAMGNPRQEIWLADNLERTGAKIGVGVGAFFDFTVGEQRRAPVWMNKLGIEWIYRLVRDPRRMWRRYVVGNPRFLARAWRTRKSDRIAPG